MFTLVKQSNLQICGKWKWKWIWIGTKQKGFKKWNSNREKWMYFSAFSETIYTFLGEKVLHENNIYARREKIRLEVIWTTDSNCHTTTISYKNYSFSNLGLFWPGFTDGA